MVDAPDSPDPASEMTQAPVAPSLVEAPAGDLPPERAAPPTPALPQPVALAQLPLDSLAPPPPLPEPPVEPQLKPDPKPEPKPEPRVEPKAELVKQTKANTAKPPAPSQASTKSLAKSNAQGEATEAATAGRVKDLRATWGAAIRKKIERRKSYPRDAGKAAGTATVRLNVTRGGGLAAVSLARSSGNAALDEAALAVVRLAGGFPAAPAELTDPSYVFTLPINFAP